MMTRRDYVWGATAVVAAVGIGLYLTRPDGSNAAAPEAVTMTEPAVAETAPPPIAEAAAEPTAAPVPAASPAPPTRTPENLLTKLRFTPGGSIRYQHEGSLRLQRSRGWIWAYIPQFDLAARPVLVIEYKSTEKGSVWLELKNAADEGLVGQLRYNLRKLAIEIPDTHGNTQRLEIDLRREFLQDTRSLACIVALSDPTAEVEIGSVGFQPLTGPLLNTKH